MKFKFTSVAYASRIAFMILGVVAGSNAGAVTRRQIVALHASKDAEKAAKKKAKAQDISDEEMLAEA